METAPQPLDRSRAMLDREQLQALDLVGNKWVVLVVTSLSNGPRRFSQIAHDLRWVGPKMLTQTLRRLEAAGLVDRAEIPGVPLQVSYSLTALGESLVSAAFPLLGWVRSHDQELKLERREVEPLD